MNFDKCPTCGSTVGVSVSDEGTGCFIPVDLTANVEKLESALEFYADENNYNCSCIGPDGTSEDHENCPTRKIDCGELAREALSKI